LDHPYEHVISLPPGQWTNSWSTVPLENLIVTQLLKFPAFYVPQWFINVFTRAPLVPILSQMSPGYIFSTHFLKIPLEQLST
jgi:hypothetical protein